MTTKAREIIAGAQRDNGDYIIRSSCDADAILEALTAAGYAIVPVEASEAMVEAGLASEEIHRKHYLGPECVQEVYRAMLQAAEE